MKVTAYVQDKKEIRYGDLKIGQAFQYTWKGLTYNGIKISEEGSFLSYTNSEGWRRGDWYVLNRPITHVFDEMFLK